MIVLYFVFYFIFRIQNGLEQGDTLSPLPFSYALEYTIRKVQEHHVGLKSNGTSASDQSTGK
jgi:hypothetical protein